MERAWARTAARVFALPDSTTISLVIGGLAASGLLIVLLLVVPNQTVITQHPYDLMIFLDAAHRIASGQVPNQDFHLCT